MAIRSNGIEVLEVTDSRKMSPLWAAVSDLKERFRAINAPADDSQIRELITLTQDLPLLSDCLSYRIGLLGGN